jgi:hypothetical protein
MRVLYASCSSKMVKCLTTNTPCTFSLSRRIRSQIDFDCGLGAMAGRLTWHPVAERLVRRTLIRLPDYLTTRNSTSGCFNIPIICSELNRFLRPPNFSELAWKTLPCYIFCPNAQVTVRYNILFGCIRFSYRHNFSLGGCPAWSPSLTSRKRPDCLLPQFP